MKEKIIMQTKTNNQQHIIIRARCTGQFMVYLATWTFQSSLFKIIYANCPGNVCPGKWLSGKRPLPDESAGGDRCTQLVKDIANDVDRPELSRGRPSSKPEKTQ